MKSSVFQVLGEISKSNSKRVKLCLMEIEAGSRYLDIRVFSFFGDKWLPTKSGVTFNKHSFPLFLAELEKHREIIELYLNAENPSP